MPDHRYVNDERTVLVWVRDDGTVQVALRSEPAATWGPPIACPVEGNQPPTIADVRGAAALALEHAEKAQGALSRDWPMDAGVAVDRCVRTLRTALGEAES